MLLHWDLHGLDKSMAKASDIAIHGQLFSWFLFSGKEQEELISHTEQPSVDSGSFDLWHLNQHPKGEQSSILLLVYNF